MCSSELHYADPVAAAPSRRAGRQGTAPTVGIGAALLIALIRFYRRHISPFTPPSCRFTPTCSRYAMDALRRYGVFRGGWLATWRVLRCNPFCKGGYDPLL